MTCPKCGSEYRDQSGRCPFCSTPQIVPRPNEQTEASRMSVAPKSLGICPDCGTEQLGAIYQISSVVAAFLKPKSKDAFVPDRHRCVRKSATG
jgi:hypothetical protein